MGIINSIETCLDMIIDYNKNKHGEGIGWLLIPMLKGVKRLEVWERKHIMLEIIAIFLLLIYGMPFFGVYLLVDKKQEANRGLGLAVMIVGIIVWCMFGIL